MSTVQRVLNQIEEALPARSWLNFPLVVAVSGGPDSVALLRLLHLLKTRMPDGMQSPLIVAHINHGLRGEQSDQEEAMVRNLAATLKLPFHSVRLEFSGDSSEEQLRDRRYHFLKQLARDQGARLIATGHQAEDQAETVLFRICRGTGLSGLAGIPQVSRLTESLSVVRPLLTVTRADIMALLAELNQDYCIDESNAGPLYSRNYLRLETIPALVKRFGEHVPKQLCRLARQAAELDEFLSSQTESWQQHIQRPSSNEIQVDCRALAPQPPVLVRHFLKSIWTEQDWPLQNMNYEKWQQLATMTRQLHADAVMFPGRIRAWVCESSLNLQRDDQLQDDP